MASDRARSEADGALIRGPPIARAHRPSGARPLRKLARRPRRRPARGPRHVHPGHRSRRHAAANVKVAIIVGATHDATRAYRVLRGPDLRRGDQVHDQRRPRLQPQRDWPKVQGRRRRRLGHRLPGPRQRLAQPLHLRPRTTRPRTASGSTTTSTATARPPTTRTSTTASPGSATLRPAPNAVVLLFHLCYASGNSEPGAKPSRASRTPRKRVDNYAAAFIKAGARAVIANGHSHDPYYIGALFTTRQTIDEYWRNAPDAHGQRHAPTRPRGIPAPRSSWTRRAPATTTGRIAGKMTPARPRT